MLHLAEVLLILCLISLGHAFGLLWARPPLVSCSSRTHLKCVSQDPMMEALQGMVNWREKDSNVAATLKFTTQSLLKHISQGTISRESFELWDDSAREFVAAAKTVQRADIFAEIYRDIFEQMMLQRLDTAQLGTFERQTNVVVRHWFQSLPQTETRVRDFVEEMNEVHLGLLDSKVVPPTLQSLHYCRQFCALMERAFKTLYSELAGLGFDMSEEGRSTQIWSWMSPVEARIQRLFPEYTTSHYRVHSRQYKSDALDHLLRRIDLALTPQEVAFERPSASKDEVPIFSGWLLASFYSHVVRQTVELDANENEELLSTMEDRTVNALRERLSDSCAQLQKRLMTPSKTEHTESSSINTWTALSPVEQVQLQDSLALLQTCSAAVYIAWQMKYTLEVMAPQAPAPVMVGGSNEGTDQTANVFAQAETISIGRPTLRRGLAASLRAVPPPWRREVSQSSESDLNGWHIRNPLLDNYHDRKNFSRASSETREMALERLRGLSREDRELEQLVGEKWAWELESELISEANYSLPSHSSAPWKQIEIAACDGVVGDRTECASLGILSRALRRGAYDNFRALGVTASRTMPDTTPMPKMESKQSKGSGPDALDPEVKRDRSFKAVLTMLCTHYLSADLTDHTASDSTHERPDTPPWMQKEVAWRTSLREQLLAMVVGEEVFSISDTERLVRESWSDAVTRSVIWLIRSGQMDPTAVAAAVDAANLSGSSTSGQSYILSEAQKQTITRLTMRLITLESSLLFAFPLQPFPLDRVSTVSLSDKALHDAMDISMALAVAPFSLSKVSKSVRDHVVHYLVTAAVDQRTPTTAASVTAKVSDSPEQEQRLFHRVRLASDMWLCRMLSLPRGVVTGELERRVTERFDEQVMRLLMYAGKAAVVRSTAVSRAAGTVSERDLQLGALYEQQLFRWLPSTPRPKVNAPVIPVVADWTQEFSLEELQVGRERICEIASEVLRNLLQLAAADHALGKDVHGEEILRQAYMAMRHPLLAHVWRSAPQISWESVLLRTAQQLIHQSTQEKGNDENEDSMAGVLRVVDEVLSALDSDSGGSVDMGQANWGAFRHSGKVSTAKQDEAFVEFLRQVQDRLLTEYATSGMIV